MRDDAQLNVEIESLLDTYRAALRAKDFALLERLWDPGEPVPIYVAEESVEPLHGWERMRAYWAGTAAGIERLSVRTWDVTTRHITDDVALVFFQMHWNA